MSDKTDELKRIRRWVADRRREPAALPARLPRANPDAIAITGLAGYFPGCMDVAAFFRRIDRDERMIGEIEEERVALVCRRDPEGEDAAFLRGQYGGFIPDIVSFDAEGFGISPAEAEEMDPRQRLLLMATRRALEDAGLHLGALRKSATGVFIACESNEYAQLMAREGFVPAMGLSQADSMIANRISWQFDLAGPSEMVNATCAGFAVALHRAFMAVKTGEIDRAIVGAASIIVLPEPYRVLRQSGQLARNKVIKSFAADADGFLRSEGVGAILIERARDAEAARRPIYALIRNAAVNFNGQGGVSMAAPNIEAHSALIKSCYRDAGIDPREITYLEAQGMGLPVADIAEWAAANRALTELCVEKGLSFEPGFCRVGTLKPLAGHMHSASSLGALLKIVRSFQTGTIHAIAGFAEPSEFCETEGAPCRFAKATEAWETSANPKLAALHSFGSGGNNAHVLLEDYEGECRAAPDRQENLAEKTFATKSFWFRPRAAVPTGTDREAAALAAILEALGREHSAAVLDAPLVELGVDSLSIATLAARLESVLDIAIRKSDLFSHSTPRRLAAFAATRATRPRAAKAARPPMLTSAEGEDEIAIVGISLRVAGADDHEAFWRLLKESRSAISTLPAERSSATGIRGGFLTSIDTFDPLFFGIAPRECETMDPRHRLLLEGAWSAIEDAGYNPRDWRGAEHGVFLGIEESDYPVSVESSITSVHGGTAPARIGYFLDTKGPLLAISTACSSSLVAIHYACQSILSGESQCALAGGCNIICQPERTWEALSRMGAMLSPDATCYAFDGRANGMVIGEGVGLVVLKRLSQARRDGDGVYAVIKGSGINYDGRTNGLTAPSGERQRELYQQVQRKSGVRPEEIGYVVAHGTGTALGDPVECHALMDAFGAGQSGEPHCALTSPKTNVGHTQAASGVVNLIAAALALHHREIPPSLNFASANPDISFEGGPFYVNTVLKAWDAPKRYAAVSSFGHTGTNAHLILGEGGPTVAAENGDAPAMIVLSAKSEERLRDYARSLLAHDLEARLEDIAYTLQTGRAAMEARLAFMARSQEELRAKLADFLSRTSVADELPDLLKAWAGGAAIDWRAIYEGKTPRRAHLPTYPFERERFWLGRVTDERVSAPTDVLIFEESWQPSPLLRDPAPPRGVAICVIGEAPESRAAAEALAARAPEIRCEFVAAARMREGLKSVRESVGGSSIVFDLRALGNPRALEKPSAIVPLVQSLAAAGLKPGRALIAAPFATDLDRCHADAWTALEKSLRVILPETRFAVVAARASEIAEKLHEEWRGVECESVIHENGERFVARASEISVKPEKSRLEAGGAYLIVGGAGELGLRLAARLAEKHRAHVVLTGRSDLSPAKRSRLLSLIKQGRGVLYLKSDVRDAEATRAAIMKAKERFGRIRGVIHCAGVESAKTILEKCESDFERVTAAKIEGALTLDQVLGEEPLDFVAYFGSSAASLGDFGSCDYAIANRFLTSFAHYRNALVARGLRSGKTVVINWPVWKEGGIASDKRDQTEFYLKSSGQRALETEEGFDLFERLLSGEGSRYLVLAGSRDRVLRAVLAKPGARPAPGLTPRPENETAGVEENLRRDVVEIAGALLKINRERLKTTVNFVDLGFDSMSLTEFALALTRHFSIDISPALFFGHATVDKLCAYLLAEHRQALQTFHASPSRAPAPPVAIAPRRETRDEPIAIIGMSGRFPQSRNIDEMWRLLSEGRDAVEEIPAERFDWREHFGDPAADRSKTNGKWGAFVPGVSEFDPLFFEISPREAEGMDPRQRLLLQEAWNALEDAGYGPRHLRTHRVGAFVGAEEGDYVFLGGDGAIVSNHNGILASRLSYFLDLRGPAMALNTACSSGLVAAHQACQSLRAGECDTAVVAAANLILTPAGLVAMGQSGMLSKDGRCAVFDKNANGMVPGEAVVAIVLKPLSLADADGDPIHALIRASGVNYDGKTNGITAPSPVAQTELIRDVFTKAGVRPDEVEFIVTHGTGTRLGDPVEIAALNDAFGGSGGKRPWCALTSTKSNFGHSFAASGLLSLVSLVEAFRHDLIPASLHCETENDYVRWDESPFFVNKTPKPWPRDGRRNRLGGVSAFGMSGTNAHLLLEEYREAAPARSQEPTYRLLALSAKTPDALKARAAAMIEALTTESDLDEISFTLLEGRHPFRCRLAGIARDVGEALALLRAFAAGEPSSDLFQGTAPLEFKETKAVRKHAEKLLAQGQQSDRSLRDMREALLALADYFCQGYDFDWAPLFGSKPPRRVHLPTYPFERERYWVLGASRPTAQPAARLQPLLHQNISDFSQQKFRSMYNGDEPFLADHIVNGRKVLPGAAILEMVHAAVEHSCGERARGAALRFRNVVWTRPLTVSAQGLDVVVSLEPLEESFKFECRTSQTDQTPTIHAAGVVAFEAAAAPAALDLALMRQRIVGSLLSAEACYAAFASGGVNYGHFYRTLRELRLGDEESLARIELPDADDRYFAHPGMLDAAFQATLGLQAASHDGAAPGVPFAIESLTLFRASPPKGWAWARRSEGSSAGDEVEKFDIALCDDDGALVVGISGFSTRILEDAADRVRTLTGDEYFLKDHGGLLPGVVALEWAREAGALAGRGSVAGLKQVIWSDPIRVDGLTRQVATRLESEGDRLGFRVGDGEQIHARGEVVVGERAPRAPTIDLEKIAERCAATIATNDCDRMLKAALGPSLKSLVAFRHNGREALASLELPPIAREQFGDASLHPSLMNGAIQAANVLAMVRHPGTLPPVPFSLETLWIYGDLPKSVFAYATPAKPEGAYDILLADRNGEVLLSVGGYYPRAVDEAVSESLIYAAPNWVPSELGAVRGAPPARAPLFILSDAASAWQAALRQNWPAARFVTLSASVESAVLEVLDRVRDCAAGGPEKKQPIVLLEPVAFASPVGAAVAGLLRTARLEQPSLDARFLRLPEFAASGLDARWIRALAAEIGHPAAEPEAMYDHSGNRYAASIREIEPDASGPTIAEGDVIWITGGLGGVGWLLARHFATDRRARVVVSGRSALGAAKRRSLDEVGPRVRYLQCDAADAAQVGRALASILETEGALNGIVHCAGVVEDNYLINKTREEAARVLAPKVAGALTLDEATRNVPLSFLALFSSLTGAYGNPGQADYAAANAFLDGFARERNVRVSQGDRSGRTLSIGWPLWRDGGMKLDAAHVELLSQDSGLTSLSAAKGVEAFHRCLRSGLDHVLVLHGDAEAVRAKMLSATGKRVAPPPVEETPGVSYRAVLEILTAMAAEQQKLPIDKIEPDAKLPQYGYDSLGFTHFATRLNRRFDLDLMPTLFFEKSSLSALARYLTDRYPLKMAAPSSAAAPRPPSTKRFPKAPQATAAPGAQRTQPIAIVGMSGRFPGAPDVDAFWKLIKANRDAVSEVPPDRWDWREYWGDAVEQRGKTKVKCAGFMAGVDRFDPAFFGISPREAIAMDPQLRLLLETVWLTIEDAGYRASELAGRRIGVFMGVSTSDYKEAWLRWAASNSGADGPALVSHFGIANRISYTFDLRGPSQPIDTACSSSLIAIHRAIEAMRMGHCEAALVGGVNVILTPDLMIEASRAGMLSEDGRCKTFDVSANGYGRGEGVAALLIKPLDEALRNGDHVYALIRGSAENHGGKAASPTAPNSVAQQALLVDAYTRAGVDPTTVGYIEAHGTGTELGDGVEIEGLKAAFAELNQRYGRKRAERHCALGSVKTNIGHLEAAAGMAGLIKVVQMLRGKEIAGNPHLKKPNPYLRLEDSPFYLASKTQPWTPSHDANGSELPLRAGVSSFGIGGSNAHVILESFDGAAAPDSETGGQHVLVLSAKTGDRLEAAAQRLLALLERSANDLPSLRDIAWTLQIGREPMAERLGFLASSLEEARTKLAAFVAGDGSRAALRGERVRHVETVAPEEGADPEAMLAAWLKGAEIDWRRLHGGAKFQRAALPGYAFDGARFWFSQARKEVRPSTERFPDASLGEVGDLGNGKPPSRFMPAASPGMNGKTGHNGKHPLAPISEIARPAKQPAVTTAPLAEALAEMLAEVLYMDVGDISLSEPFVDLGLDSVIGVEWTKAIHQRFGVKFPATRLYDHPNLLDFAAFLSGQLGSPAPTAKPASLDEILDRVQRGELDVDEAETLIERLGLAAELTGHS